MRKVVTLLVAVCLQGLVIAAMAQEQPGTVGEVIRIRPKAGMEKQFEAAGKEHIAWHRQKNDPWAWFVWQVGSGPRTGEYVAATFGHKWADFDTAPVSREEDDGDVGTRVGSYTESVETQFVIILPKHSRPPQGSTPSKFATVVTIRVKHGMEDAYMNAVSKIPKAMEKTNWPGRYVFYALANGGEHPTSSWCCRARSGRTSQRPTNPSKR